MNKSVQQLRKECAGVTPKATTMTPDQLRISELEKRMKQVELEKETLKNIVSSGGRLANSALLQTARIFACSDRQCIRRARHNDGGARIRLHRSFCRPALHTWALA